MATRTLARNRSARRTRPLRAETPGPARSSRKDAVCAFLRCFFVVLFAGIAGCGDGRPARVAVAGRVLIDGKPLERGYVRFVPQGARPSGGQIGADGHFVLTCFDGQDGAVPGRHSVEIVANEVVGGNAVRWLTPKKYASYETSGIIQEIAGPNPDIKIELTWGGEKPFVEHFVGRENRR